VYVADVYAGPGLAGVPRGTVKRLRLFAFDYGYRNLANHTYVGIDGPWDVHRILGTVPVEPDGSAYFRVPANTPIALQPLDGQGRAVQLMRSWFTAMPGENLSCVGCHEPHSDAAPVRPTFAGGKAPEAIAPWHGPARGFSFKREVQPVLDAHCIACHDGKPRDDGKKPPNLTSGLDRGFDRAYTVLHRYTYRPGPESDYHLLPPAEYHAEASELVQMIRKNHGGVNLDAEGFERIAAWIDLNVPCHGTWGEFRTIPGNERQRRLELRRQYAGIEDDYEVVPDLPAYKPARTGAAGRAAVQAKPMTCSGWPFDAKEAAQRQRDAARAASRQPTDASPSAQKTLRNVEIGRSGDGKPVGMELTLVPAGEFIMGDAEGYADEAPRVARIAKPFWMGTFEVANAEFALFDPGHDSRYFNRMGKDQASRGEPMNLARQPVVRVSWERAMAFCRWLSERTGKRFTLPTEEQWEWACRAGTVTPLWFGEVEDDFSAFANFADKRMASFPSGWRLAERRFDDGGLVTVSVEAYKPNPWGLYSMHGNAAEWTLSTDRSREAPDAAEPERKVVRGGSFYDRPLRCRSAFRLSYPAWQRVYNVGFRVVMEE
jgi:formylglycine-generating enzyme required for sulfatase activity